jgi:hypothetical protein
MRHQRTRHEHDAAASALVRQVLLLGSAGALLWNSWRCVQRTHSLRRDGKSRKPPEPLQTWEGEGGRPVPRDPSAATDSSAGV